MRPNLFAAFGLSAALVAGVAQGQLTSTATTITVDEGGKGTIGTAPLPGTLMPDPTSASGSPVLAYPLPFLVTPGDVVLIEPGTPEPANSDLIRFVVPQGVGPDFTTDGNVGFSLLLFYSDLPAAGETAALGDLGVPPAAPGAKIFTEVGSEAGPNGFTYTPGVGDPGSPSSILGVSGATYTFISDSAVPLPSTVWAGLALMGVVGVWTAFRRGNAMP